MRDFHGNHLLNLQYRNAVLFGLMFTFCCGTALAQPHAAVTEKSQKPAVIVLKIASDPATTASEERFISELALALNRFRVVPVTDPTQRFSTMSFSERLDLIRRISAEYDAVATVWVERWTANKTLLNLTAMSTGRALLKIVEVKSGPSSEAELAFAAETLLGEAYLFSPEPSQDALREKVEKVQQTVTARSFKTAGASPIFAITVTGGVFGALYPRQGPSLLTAGGLSWMTRLKAGWFFSPEVLGFGGPREQFQDGVLSGWGIQATFSAGYHFRLGKSEIGPGVGAGIRWQRLDAFFGDRSNSISIVGFRAEIALDLQFFLAENLSLTLRPSLGILPKSVELKRVSNTEVVTTTPFVEGGIFAGLRYFFHRKIK